MDRERIKKILSAVLCVAALIAIIVLIIKAPDFSESAQEEIPYEDITYSTDPYDETLEFVPYFTMATEPEVYPETVVNENVTIEQVPNDPGEVIDRTITIDETHPEYLPADEYEPFISIEGKVYRNNKVISIDVYDEALDKTFTISFGYPTGKCNRFLYLNPVITSSGDVEDYYIWFEIPQGGGLVYNFNTADTADTGMCYTFLRALEQKTTAQYVDAQAPGAVWFTSKRLDRPVYIDAVIYNGAGRMIASIRITIEKDESDGTFSITDLDSNNLLDQNERYPEYTSGELNYIVAMASETFHDSDKVNIGASYQEDTDPSKFCIILRPEETGLLYDEFIPVPGAVRQASNYINSGMDILAVTYKPTELISHTMYFYVICQPSVGAHGIYQYIGRDYPSFMTVDDLISAGWKQSQ